MHVGVVAIHLGKVHGTDIDGATGGLFDASEAFEGGAFAGPIHPQQGKHLSSLHPKRGAPDRHWPLWLSFLDIFLFLCRVKFLKSGLPIIDILRFGALTRLTPILLRQVEHAQNILIIIPQEADSLSLLSHSLILLLKLLRSDSELVLLLPFVALVV
jgi:hypothetical protein